MIEQILESLANKRKILILTHNNPDPDAMAAALGLKYIIAQKLNKKATISYMGVIGRLENRELVRQCHIEMHQSFHINFNRFDHIVVVDTQPQAGNVFIPEDRVVNTVIDHHIVKKVLPKRKDLIVDIRSEYGSTCTIITEYMVKLGIIPDKNTATALYYGITTDAIGKARDSIIIDQQMLGSLFPHLSINKLSKIQNPDLPRYHFKTLKRAIDNSVIIEELLFCDLSEVRNGDLIAETADFMLKMREIKCVFIIGKLENIAIFSLRYKTKRKSVGHIAMRMVKGIGYGGGHMKSAGGQIPLTNKNYSEIVFLLKSRLLKSLGIAAHAEEKPI